MIGLVITLGTITLIIILLNMLLNFFIINQNINIMAKQAEIAQELRDLKVQNDKSRTEILNKFATLEAAIEAAGNSTPEMDEALADLKTSIQTDDDMIPDADPVPPADPVDTTEEPGTETPPVIEEPAPDAEA